MTPLEPTHVLAGACEGPAGRDTLARCLALAEEVCASLALAEADALALRLAVDEACTNVMEHGYAGEQSGPVALEIWAPRAPAGELRIRILDRAALFDPGGAKLPDLDAGVEERAVGGLGWYFIHEMMDAVHHAPRAGGGNQLELVRVMRGNEGELSS